MNNSQKEAIAYLILIAFLVALLVIIDKHMSGGEEQSNGCVGVPNWGITITSMCGVI